MKNELYRKVFIRSSKDLPKEVDNYHVMLKTKDARLLHFPFKGDVGYNIFKLDWLKDVDYWLQPIAPLSREKVIEVLRSNFYLLTLDQEKWFKIVASELCDVGQSEPPKYDREYLEECMNKSRLNQTSDAGQREENPFINDAEQQEIRNYYSGNSQEPVNDKAIIEKQDELIELMQHEPEKDDDLRLHNLFKSELERLEQELKQLKRIDHK